MAISCPECGKSCSTNDNFCPNRGIKLYMRCPTCQSVIDKEDQRGYCNRCSEPMCKYCKCDNSGFLYDCSKKSHHRACC